MNRRFVIRNKWTKESSLAGARYATRYVRWFLLFVLVCSAGRGIYTLIQSGIGNALEDLLCAAFVGLLALFFPQLAARFKYKALPDGDAEGIILTFTEDGYYSNTHEMDSGYDVFTQIVDVKTHFILVRGNDAVVITKAGFIEGDPADFIPFINEKAHLPKKKR